MEGLGDADGEFCFVHFEDGVLTVGSIPSEMYSTSDPESLKKFAGSCDVLIAVLPSTPQTQWMFTSELFSESSYVDFADHTGAMRKEAIFVNVGRGDLAKSGEQPPFESVISSDGDRRYPLCVE